jgi:8-oxo-dGTP diphosphatase
MTLKSTEAIVSFLKQNVIKNMNILYFMENNPIYSLEQTGDSVVLRGESDHRWVYISSPNEQELAAVMKTLRENDRFFAAIEDWMLPILTTNKTLVWQLSTMKLVLPEHVTFPQMFQSHIVPLSVNDTRYLYEHSLYQGVTSLDYIRDRIQHGLSAGIHESGKLVAWAMTHDDSAIGFLDVLEAYRRKGYAYELTVYLIHQLRKQGKIPFVHIEETNLKSIHLATKLGFRKDRRLHWLKFNKVLAHNALS